MGFIGKLRDRKNVQLSKNVQLRMEGQESIQSTVSKSTESIQALSVEELTMVENIKRNPSSKVILGPLKNVVKSMITDEKCYVIPVERCSVPNLPDNHELIPSYQRETVEDYMENVCEIKRRNWEDIKEENQNSNGKPKIERIRRKREEGSYSNSSVQEEDLHPLLRFTWKGKLNKLKHYLKDLNKQGKHHKVNRHDKQGRTALHFAASWGCDRTVKELLAVPGIDINVTDEQGKTPLYKAVEIGDLKTVKLLAEAGANVRVPALDGRNVFEYALQELGDDYFSIINYLYTEGEMHKERKDEAKISYLHLLTLSRKSISVSAVMEDLIKHGEFVNATEGKGRTPLILACKMGKDDLVRILIEYGADIKHIDMYLKSSIQYCTANSVCYKYVRRALNRLPKKKQRKKRDTKESVEQQDIMDKSLDVKNKNL